MKIFTQRAMSYARDSLQVYGDFRRKAKAVTEDLKRRGVDSVYLNGDDQIMDILRLTCLEAGLTISDLPETYVLETDGHVYRLRNLK